MSLIFLRVASLEVDGIENVFRHYLCLCKGNQIQVFISSYVGTHIFNININILKGRVRLVSKSNIVHYSHTLGDTYENVTKNRLQGMHFF